MENGNKEVVVDEFGSTMDVPDSELIKNNNSYYKDGEGGDVVTPNGRPVREKKAVDRYSISSPPSRSSTPKTISIAKGSGTPLKDIPNVAFKLSKRKADDTLQLLHLILFGKRAKAHNLKKDIGLFSGFVWEENEEKQRAKMKERLDKLVKDKLVDFCDVLNIPIFKSAVKKEDLLVKLLEFLESPHATTEVLLADKEQKSKKQKRSAKSSRSRSKNASGEKSAKKTQSGEKRKRSSTGEENETDDMDDKMSGQSHSSGEEDEAFPKQDSDQDQTRSNEEKDEVEDKKTSPQSSSKDDSEAKSGTKSVNMKKCSSVKSTKSPATSAKKTKDTPNKPKSSKKTKDAPKNSRSAKKTADTSEKSSSVIEPSASPSKARGSSSKKRQKVDEETKRKKSISMDKSPSKKRARKSTKSLGGEEETDEEDKVEPTKEELHGVAVNILKEVDFNTATLSDILRLLGSHFGLDLMHRKSEVKAIIQEVIESMSGGDSDEGEDDDNEEEDDENDKDSGEE